MNNKGKTSSAVRWGLSLAALLVVAVAGLYIGGCIRNAMKVREYDRNGRLQRSDLPGYGRNLAADPEWYTKPENHCTEESGVTLVDEMSRAWRVEVPGWNLFWESTNAVGAYVMARNVDTGEMNTFILGAEEDQLGNAVQTVGEDVTVDCLPNLRQFLWWDWLEPAWPEKEFRAFAKQMTVTSISPEEVGQTVAFGNDLNLHQTSDFNGSLMMAGNKVCSVQLRLFDLPLLSDEDGEIFTAAYTSGSGMEWELQWQQISAEEMAEEGVTLFAGYADSQYVEIAMERDYVRQKQIGSMEQAVEEAQKALDHISPREPA